MRMPQDFVDAINSAIREVNPTAWEMTSGSMTLGSDFDEWLGPGAIMKYGFDGIPAEVQAAFEAKFAERREEIKAALVTSSVDIEKRRMAGTLVSEPPVTSRKPQKIDDWLKEIKA